MEEKEKIDIFESAWRFLASVKLAIFTFIIIALSSIVGTIVEQGAEPAKNIALLAKFFGDNAAPTVYNIFAAMGFMDMYGSWWFTMFLVIFSINLIVCSIDRFPKTWRSIKKPQRPLPENSIKSMPIRKELKAKTTLNVAKDEFMNVLKSSRYNVSEASEDNSVQLYTQKNKYARLTVYVVHLSIILIFIGAVIGARYGFKGYVNIIEGRTTNVAYLSPSESYPLGFTVKCNWYETQYYGDSSTPMEFMSELVVLENGREVMKKVIEVNNPLKYKGITFFQSSYGVLNGVMDDFVIEDTESKRQTTLQPKLTKFPNQIGSFVIKLLPLNGQENTIALRRGDSFDIPGTDIKGTIVGFSPTLDRDRMTGALGTSEYYRDQMLNPAVAIEVEAPGRKPFVGWYLKGDPTWIMPEGGHELEFIDFRGVEYTGLQVARDPGVWIIYIACILMGVSLYLCFFISNKKIWINIAHEAPGKKGPVKITVGGRTNRNKLNFEKEIEKLLSHASDAIEGRSKK
ncbi:MAG: cytochrome c biogenesis protein ResB [Nitrospiraceae bacterium]|nr:MAG: cytochrome c biogenesis protein ResB [Nitrospiraceae bacterium]